MEYIIVTPSQHRVHHAINPEYIDKNLGQIFCIWDRMFGTFQEELAHVAPQYGILKPAKTWNPIRINFQHLWRLFLDAWRTKNFWDKIRIWFMPTGWRPRDVKEKYPMDVIMDVYGFERYRTPTNRAFNGYIIFQLVMSLILLLFMFGNFGNLSGTELLWYGGLVFLGIYGYTSLMDGDPYAVWIEIFRGIIGCILILWTDDWFGLNAYFPMGRLVILLYFLSTIAGSIYFSNFFKKKRILA
ncbi:sterol desaturase family protein [Maribacter litopenaei]|uniref:sterol desaturase family protein n=1 Tax=Maribacter litopenaei TaxID=2976127 RepID=UPI003084410C